MDVIPEVLRKAINEIGGDSRHDVSFPAGGAVPETESLAKFNFTAMSSGKHNSKPQTPGTVAVTCSKIDVDLVQGARRAGHIIDVAGRGAIISEGGVTSVNYGLGLKAPFMQVLVHSCTQKGICRSTEFQKLDDWGVRLPMVPLGFIPNLEGSNH